MGCPIPSSQILLADGSSKAAGDLKVGDKLDTLHEHSLERDIHEVTYVEIIDSEVLCLTFEGKTFHCSPTHKFYLSKQKAWIEAKDLIKGQKVLQLDNDIEFIDATKIDDGKVVVIKVDEAHTYICEGIFSHNKGDTHVHYPKQEKDTTFQDYLKDQQRQERNLEYRDWQDDNISYKKKKAEQASGRKNWAGYKQGIQDQLSSGLISFSDATNKLSDFSKEYNLQANSILSPGKDPRRDWTDEQKAGITFDDPPSYTTPEEWQNWTPTTAQSQLQKFYTGTGEIDPVTGEKDRGLLGKRRDTGVEAAYQELLGRDVTSDELSTARQRFDTGYYKDIDSLKSSLTSGSEYQDKFQQSYLGNYYDTEFGKELRDAEGTRTGKRKFSFDKTLLPSYGEDIKNRTGVTLPDFGDSFTGTPAELNFQLDNIGQTRKYIFDSGLTALQGDINKNIESLKVEGQKEITKIAKEGDIYQSVVNAFNFS